MVKLSYYLSENLEKPVLKLTKEHAGSLRLLTTLILL